MEILTPENGSNRTTVASGQTRGHAHDGGAADPVETARTPGAAAQGSTTVETAGAASRPLSPADISGLVLFLVYLLLLSDIRLAPVPLLAFLLACMIAPFQPRIGFFLPVVSRGRRGETGVALTFDDGPDPEITPRLLDLLDKHSIPATFFVTGERAARYPAIIRDILARGHSIGNHSFKQMPLLMLMGMRTLRREIESVQSELGRFGIVPLAFRPPVGITNSRLWRILREQGMYCVTFSCRVLDLGNRRIARLAARVLRAVSPGDIVALHDVAPPSGKTEKLLEEFDTLIRGLKERELQVVPLARLIGKEVMLQRAPAADLQAAAAGFPRSRAPAFVLDKSAETPYSSILSSVSPRDGDATAPPHPLRWGNRRGTTGGQELRPQ